MQFRRNARAAAAALFDPDVKPLGWSANNAMLLYALLAWGVERSDESGIIIEGTYNEVLNVWKRTESDIAATRARTAAWPMNAEDLAFFDRFRGRSGQKIKKVRTISDNFKILYAMTGAHGQGADAIVIDLHEVRFRDGRPPVLQVIIRPPSSAVEKLRTRRLPKRSRPPVRREDLEIAASLVHVAAVLGERTERPYLAGRLAAFLNAEFDELLAPMIESHIEANRVRRAAAAAEYSPLARFRAMMSPHPAFNRIMPELEKFERGWRVRTRYDEKYAEALAVYEAGQDLQSVDVTDWANLDSKISNLYACIYLPCVAFSTDIHFGGLREGAIVHLETFVREAEDQDFEWFYEKAVKTFFEKEIRKHDARIKRYQRDVHANEGRPRRRSAKKRTT